MYVVVWCEMVNGQRVKRREEFRHPWPGQAKHNAQARAAELRVAGFAACVEVA